MTQNFQEKFLSYALNLARQNLGSTAPNPAVACVIVKDGMIISTGITAKTGRPHAETVAIDKISDKNILNGAEIYVTLEPCSHTGKTGPCADEIIKNKFAKVVIAALDPDERVNGKGVKKLRDAGIEVIIAERKEAVAINKGFFKSRISGMPYVTLKLATSLDGKIATKDFESKWITSQKARLFSHHLRSINDAILIGATTAQKDDPSLDCRVPGLEEFSPKRIVIAGNSKLNSKLKIFENSEKIPTIILTGKSAENFSNYNVEVISCQEKDGVIDLKDALKKLTESGVNSVLIEGGQKTATEFLKEGLVDELVWIRSRKLIGNDGIAAIGELGISKISDALDDFERLEIKELGEDVAEIYLRRSPR